ncbi:styrene monooxygenase/indole monooxygenase family protein [Streptomyces sp. NBC_00083]|uniref:styrene monooxygenase/indole monooxygenase family protein n=1 Tax=Streptomyces sp. NBC_00083 TaxID=2975647 RepID=UPI00224FEB4D|nr:styrene monooxygenase/indole monooxygenase family protein [Streptomyces sp. NBC_00083]MCX5384242.1 FAD-binding oxidoreductase [Streptomyces sp. NBC_00083]
MRRIAIIGAGQAGLQLALGLQAAEYDVTLLSERTAEEIRHGSITSTQLMLGPALALERSAGLNLWDDRAPLLTGLEVTQWDPAGPEPRAKRFTTSYDAEARSVDQRVKLPAWLDLFAARGGRVETRAVEARDVAGIAARHDLTVVATGRGALSALFGRDTRRSVYDRPQRTLAAFYAHGVTGRADESDTCLRVTVVPSAGDVIVLRALTVGGPCEILLMEAKFGGPYDCWGDRPEPRAGLRRAVELLREYAPWEYERFVGAEPTDAGAALYGAVTPTVRHGVAELGEGRCVLGMADAVVVNDPLTGQGANNAARSAAGYLDAILKRGELPYDSRWMRQTFEEYWEQARHSQAFTDLMLRQPPAEQVGRVLGAAFEHPEVAHRFANGYADPRDYRDWLIDPARTDAYLAEIL